MACRPPRPRRRLSLGNPGDERPVGAGGLELRIDYGPGYRVYLIHHGPHTVVLLCGGDKSMQDRDIGAPKTWRRKIEMAVETLPWDPTEHLKTTEDVREYLEAAFEDGDPALIAAALGDVARSRDDRNCT